MNSKTKTTITKEDGKPALTTKLRFPEFREAEGWKETQLQKIARPVSDRAVTGDGDNVLSLSGEHGLVLQSDYFGKKVAGDSAERYLKLNSHDFVYNDRTTKASVYGTIKRLADYFSIDISADVHVRRVFARLGLCASDATVEQVIYKARALNPEFPGIMDLPSWEMGRRWCKSRGPECAGCYMKDLCLTANADK